ncbi:GAF domain-containing protein [Actinoplanes sp. NPDC051633]|uniref:GAF domain-containing protein n=1 Tax=Actinoplanes sp. NPDC051633 TaxID=3155670 RepID=UPI00341CB7C7
MATPSASTPPQDRPGHGLRDDLIALAGTPDDNSGVPGLLRSIVQYAADLLPPVSYASVTTHEEGSYATVAMSSEVALAVDDAQYADGTGPCLDTLQTSDPVAVPRIDATVKWPGFRSAARRLGLRASLSIPLAAGRGVSIAALNLYGRDAAAMAPLSAAVLATFESTGEDGLEARLGDLGSGPLELIEGLIGASRVRAEIQRALGMIMATKRTNTNK